MNMSNNEALGELVKSRVDAVFELVETSAHGLDQAHGNARVFLILADSSVHLARFVVKSSQSSVPAKNGEVGFVDVVDAALSCASVPISLGEMSVAAVATIATGPVGWILLGSSALIAIASCGISVERLTSKFRNEISFYDSDPVGRNIEVAVKVVSVAQAGLKVLRESHKIVTATDETLLRGLGLNSRMWNAARLTLLDLPDFALSAHSLRNLLDEHGRSSNPDDLHRILKDHARKNRIVVPLPGNPGARFDLLSCFRDPAYLWSDPRHPMQCFLGK